MILRITLGGLELMWNIKQRRGLIAAKWLVLITVTLGMFFEPRRCHDCQPCDTSIEA
jgi:hypothetical protein